MKKNILFAAVAAVALAFTACTEEPVIDNGGNVNPTPRVKTTADLIGTNWEYTLDLSAGMDPDLLDCMDSATIADMLTLTFGLNFDADYAHLTFPEDVIGLSVVEDGDNYTVEEIQGMDYVYTYDASTTSGTLTGGNLDDIVVPFTYNNITDQITIDLMVADEGYETDAMPFLLVFSRVE